MQFGAQSGKGFIDESKPRWQNNRNNFQKKAPVIRLFFDASSITATGFNKPLQFG